MKLLVWSFCLLFIACSSNQINEEQEEVLDNQVDSSRVSSEEKIIKEENPNEDFLKFYQRLTMSIGTKNHEVFNSCIHSDMGLYIIETAGAVPLIMHVYDVNDFKSFYQKKGLLEMTIKGINKEPLFEELPQVICDEEIYDKQGCYARESSRFKESRIWNFYSVEEKDIQAIESLVETVKLTVINTSNHTFHFSEIDGKWFLTFLDLRTPCSA